MEALYVGKCPFSKIRSHIYNVYIYSMYVCVYVCINYDYNYVSICMHKLYIIHVYVCL